MMNGWGLPPVGAGAGFPGAARAARFEETYHCYSVAFADKAHLEVRLFLFVLSLSFYRVAVVCRRSGSEG